MRNMTLDVNAGQPPRPGHYIRSTAGTTWRICAVRVVKSRVHPRRFMIAVEREAPPEGAPVFDFRWNDRKPKNQRLRALAEAFQRQEHLRESAR